MFTQDARVDSLIHDGWCYEAAIELASTGFYHAPIPVLNLYHRIVCCSCDFDVENPEDAHTAIEMHFYYGKDSCQWKIATRENQRVQGTEQRILRQAQELLAVDVQQAEQNMQRNLALEEFRFRQEQTNEQHGQLAEQFSQHNIENKLFACRCCLSAFTSNTKLHRHIKKHHSKHFVDPVAPPKNVSGVTPTPFTCRRCSATFPSNTKLHIHLKKQHGRPIQTGLFSENRLVAFSAAPSSEPSPFADSVPTAPEHASASEHGYMDLVQATSTLSAPWKPSSAAKPLALTWTTAEPTAAAPPPIPWHTKPKAGAKPETH